MKHIDVECVTIVESACYMQNVSCAFVFGGHSNLLCFYGMKRKRRVEQGDVDAAFVVRFCNDMLIPDVSQWGVSSQVFHDGVVLHFA